MPTKLSVPWFAVGCLVLLSSATQGAEKIDFNRDIRPILSNNCFQCHGPDASHRPGGGAHGLRLDTAAGAREDLGGYAAVAPGKPSESHLYLRVISTDADEVMPPKKTGKKLSAREVELLKTWIEQGAPYAQHWSYQPPRRSELPQLADTSWCRTPIDHFILQKLIAEKLRPSSEADRATLARRAALDLTGLPPSLEELDRFLADPATNAYERYIDSQLQKEAYGEHWARMWLDLARYADSAGYADDPPRTIWAYRDWVIQSFNRNQPFDAFTIEQLAGDMLPNPTADQLIATAFHRNTLTNNEGGTSDEEYRNVAIVDRVNTTLAVWMGTSFACAQCHSHKYDPLTQEEYFKVFAILNNSADADRRDESPLHSFLTPDQEKQKQTWQERITALEAELKRSSPERLAALEKWESALPRAAGWKSAIPTSIELASGKPARIHDDGIVTVAEAGEVDSYTLTLPLQTKRLTGLRLEAIPNSDVGGNVGHAGNFVISRVHAQLVPRDTSTTPPAPRGKFVRIESPGSQKFLMLAEVQAFSGDKNIAPSGKAKQISTDYGGRPELAIDGKTDGHYFQGKSVSHTDRANDPWWEVELPETAPIDRIVLWNRTDADYTNQFIGIKVRLLDADRHTVWESEIKEPTPTSREILVSSRRSITFAAAVADFSQSGFAAENVLKAEIDPQVGWAVAPHTKSSHELLLVTKEPTPVSDDLQLRVTLDQKSAFKNHTLAKFRLSYTADDNVREFTKLPAAILAIINTPAAERTDKQRAELLAYYLETVAPELKQPREELAKLRKQASELRPITVPIMQELPPKQARKTHIQLRGNFLDLGAEVTPGVPAVFPPLPAGQQPDRLGLARWLVSRENPLTARVMVNRLWEQIFGVGLVRTSEEFGSQGEQPSHAELLDYLAVDFMESGWDVKRLLKLMVMSAAYRQTSKVDAALAERDPDNRLLARGPRFRLGAEMIRDQALAVAGLLSNKMYGPPVRPPRPALGLSAAFGGGLDWQTSDGEDKHRRGLYTEWRRTSPYPSMTTFDAPNREVCTLRRGRTNTPLQALVTLNDPVYVEAAQGLARRIMAQAGSPESKIHFAYRATLCRPPSDQETKVLASLFAAAQQDYAQNSAEAQKMATVPLGPLPPGLEPADAAAWTVVANVLLNLDETLMKR